MLLKWFQQLPGNGSIVVFRCIFVLVTVYSYTFSVSVQFSLGFTVVCDGFAGFVGGFSGSLYRCRGEEQLLPRLRDTGTDNCKEKRMKISPRSMAFA